MFSQTRGVGSGKRRELREPGFALFVANPELMPSLRGNVRTGGQPGKTQFGAQSMRSFRRFAIILFSVAAFIASLFIIASISSRQPKESKIISAFQRPSGRL